LQALDWQQVNEAHQKQGGDQINDRCAEEPRFANQPVKKGWQDSDVRLQQKKMEKGIIVLNYKK
jgi:hypothetical protein